MPSASEGQKWWKASAAHHQGHTYTLMLQKGMTGKSVNDSWVCTGGFQQELALHVWPFDDIEF